MNDLKIGLVDIGKTGLFLTNVFKNLGYREDERWAIY